MSHGLFYRWPCYVSGSGNIAVVLLSIEGQRALGFHQKYLNLCPKMNEGLTGLNDMRVVIMTQFSFLGELSL